MTFPSTFYALRAEKFVQEVGLEGRLIPVPQELSSLCGLTMEVAPESVEQILKLLKSKGVKMEKQVLMAREQGRLKIIKSKVIDI